MTSQDVREQQKDTMGLRGSDDQPLTQADVDAVSKRLRRLQRQIEQTQAERDNWEVKARRLQEQLDDLKANDLKTSEALRKRVKRCNDLEAAALAALEELGEVGCGDDVMGDLEAWEPDEWPVRLNATDRRCLAQAYRWLDSAEPHPEASR